MNNTSTKTRVMTRATGALALAVGLVLSAPSAQAQTRTSSNSKQFSEQMTNPCNGDSFVAEGHEHFHTKTTVGADGSIKFQLQKHANAQGTTPVTQIQYTFGDQETIIAKFDSDPGPMIFRHMTKAVSQGPRDNFYVTFVETFNSRGEQTNFRMEAECRGGGGAPTQ